MKYDHYSSVGYTNLSVFVWFVLPVLKEIVSEAILIFLKSYWLASNCVCCLNYNDVIQWHLLFHRGGWIIFYQDKEGGILKFIKIFQKDRESKKMGEQGAPDAYS
jgi:hypothetical protein